MVRALNDLFSLSLSDNALAALAARLGSDCPFFIYNRPMFVSGRGDVLEPFDIDLSDYRIEVAVPEGVAVSTKEAYAGIDGMPLGGNTSTLREVLRLPSGTDDYAVKPGRERLS